MPLIEIVIEDRLQICLSIMRINLREVCRRCVHNSPLHLIFTISLNLRHHLYSNVLAFNVIYCSYFLWFFDAFMMMMKLLRNFLVPVLNLVDYLFVVLACHRSCPRRRRLGGLVVSLVEKQWVWLLIGCLIFGLLQIWLRSLVAFKLLS